MNEFIKKLIDRLGKIGWVYADYYPDETAVHRQSKKSVPYDEVIKIVNQLAEEYNNDFCEWKPIIANARMKYKNCEFAEDTTDTFMFEFCPYCGKKIKVVE